MPGATRLTNARFALSDDDDSSLPPSDPALFSAPPLLNAPLSSSDPPRLRSDAPRLRSDPARLGRGNPLLCVDPPPLLADAPLAESLKRVFNTGDLVWGQIRGYPSWPGKLVPAGDVKGHHVTESGKVGDRPARDVGVPAGLGKGRGGNRALSGARMSAKSGAV